MHSPLEARKTGRRQWVSGPKSSPGGRTGQMDSGRTSAGRSCRSAGSLCPIEHAIAERLTTLARSVKRINVIPLLVLFGLVAIPSPGLAQSGERDLSQVSLEELMNIEITSASRKEQRAGDVAAAVFVITQDDIRRSGMTTIPDVLRLAPGVDVAQINSNKWAVTIRGFNGLYANKLLGLVDGRSVYSHLFSGALRI